MPGTFWFLSLRHLLPTETASQYSSPGVSPASPAPLAQTCCFPPVRTQSRDAHKPHRGHCVTQASRSSAWQIPDGDHKVPEGYCSQAGARADGERNETATYGPCTASDLPGASLQLLPQARQEQQRRRRDISLAVSKISFSPLFSHSISHLLPGKIWQNQCCTNQA